MEKGAGIGELIEGIGIGYKAIAEANGINIDNIFKIPKMIVHAEERQLELNSKYCPPMSDKIKKKYQEKVDEQYEKLIDKSSSWNIFSRYKIEKDLQHLGSFMPDSKNICIQSVENVGCVEQIKNSQEGMRKDFEKIAKQYSSLSSTVSQQGITLDQHGKAINRLEHTIDTHGRVLSQHTAILQNHSGRISSLEYGYARHEGILRVHSGILQNHEGRISNIESGLARHDTILRKHQNQIIGINNKVNKLADVVQVQGVVLTKTVENINALNQSVKSINHCLSVHENKIKESIQYTHEVQNELRATQKATAKEFENVYDRINSTNENMQKGFNIVQTQIDETQNYFEQRCNGLASSIAEEHLYVETNFASIQDKFKAADVRFANLETQVGNHNARIMMLEQSNADQKALIIFHGKMLAEQQEFALEMAENVKNVYQEVKVQQRCIVDQQTEIDELVKKNEIQVEEANKMKALINQSTNCINDIYRVLDSHAEILAVHSAKILEMQNTIGIHSAEIVKICKTLYEHSSILREHNIRITALEDIVKIHENLFGKLTDQLNNHDERLSALEVIVDKMLKRLNHNEVQTKVNEIKSKILKEKDGSVKITEFAEFMLMLKNGISDFGIDDVLKGAKLIFGDE